MAANTYVIREVNDFAGDPELGQEDRYEVTLRASSAAIAAEIAVTLWAADHDEDDVWTGMEVDVTSAVDPTRRFHVEIVRTKAFNASEVKS